MLVELAVRILKMTISLVSPIMVRSSGPEVGWYGSGDCDEECRPFVSPRGAGPLILNGRCVGAPPPIDVHLLPTLHTITEYVRRDRVSMPPFALDQSEPVALQSQLHSWSLQHLVLLLWCLRGMNEERHVMAYACNETQSACLPLSAQDYRATSLHAVVNSTRPLTNRRCCPSLQ